MTNDSPVPVSEAAREMNRRVTAGDFREYRDPYLAGLARFEAAIRAECTTPAAPATGGMREACEPWKYHVGDPPAYGSPLAAVFDAGIAYAYDRLADALGVQNYTTGDGSEDYQQDVQQTGVNILLEAGYCTEDGDLLTPAVLAATPPIPEQAPASPPADVEQIALDVADTIEAHMKSSGMIWSLGKDLPDDWMTELRSITVAALEGAITPSPAGTASAREEALEQCASLAQPQDAAPEPAAAHRTEREAREEIARVIDPTAWKLDRDGYLVEQVHSGDALAKADRILALTPPDRVAQSEMRLRDMVKSILPIGDDRAPDTKVMPIYVNMGELRAIKAAIATAPATGADESGES